MKRSRACEDLVALETQKRNKTVDAGDDATAVAMASLLTRSASAEEELSRLLEAHALQHQQYQQYQQLHHRHTFDDAPNDPLDAALAECLGRRSRLHRSDTRAVSLLERDARDAQDALAFKHSPKFVSTAAELLQNSPDTTDHIFTDVFFAPRHRRRSADAPAFDMSSFRHVLEPQSAA